MRNYEPGLENILDSDIAYIKGRLTQELQKLSGRKLLFTGGGGFLGYMFLNMLSRLGNKNREENLEITILENFSRGKKSWLNKLSSKPNVKLIEHDISKKLPKELPDFDYIIHAASIASPMYYRKYPIETIDANVGGLRILLDYAKQKHLQNNSIEGMLFFSTSEIYGDPTDNSIPTPETYKGNVSCTGPRACYDESKRLGETLCVNFAHQYNLPITIARPFNNYGPGLDINDKRIIPDIAKNILANKDIVLFSDGLATRTFCYVADAIIGYTKILINGRSGESYNIGTDKPEISMNELAEKLVSIGKEFLDYSGKIVYVKSSDKNYNTDNPQRRCPDLSKARTELKYNPSILLEDGLRKSLLWYKDNYL
tara:strand:- start:4884 stop:5993 length:1110 start_codon:yes stop_codon:yes gene_type:complete